MGFFLFGLQSVAILFTTLPIQAVVKYGHDNEADQNDDRKNIQEAQIHLTTPTSSINNQLSYYAGKKKRRQADGVLFFFNIYLSLSFAQGGSAKNQTRSVLPKQRLWPSSKE